MAILVNYTCKSFTNLTPGFRLCHWVFVIPFLRQLSSRYISVVVSRIHLYFVLFDCK